MTGSVLADPRRAGLYTDFAARGAAFRRIAPGERDTGTGRFKPKGAPNTPKRIVEDLESLHDEAARYEETTGSRSPDLDAKIQAKQDDLDLALRVEAGGPPSSTFDDVPDGWQVGSDEDGTELVPSITDDEYARLVDRADALLDAGTPVDGIKDWPYEHDDIRRRIAEGREYSVTRKFQEQVAAQPVVDGITYRGVHLGSSANDTFEGWQGRVGGILNMQAPSSSSLRPEVAARQLPVPGSPRPRTIFEIRGKGNYIGRAVGGRSEEVVMPAGPYRVRSVHRGAVREWRTIGEGLRAGEPVYGVFPTDEVTVVRLEQM